MHEDYYTLFLRLPGDETRQLADQLDTSEDNEARRAALLSSVRDFGDAVEFKRVEHSEFVL